MFRGSGVQSILMTIGLVVVLTRLRDCLWVASYVGVAAMSGEVPDTRPRFVGEGQGRDPYTPEEEQEYGYWKKNELSAQPSETVNPLVGAAVVGLGIALMGSAIALRIANRSDPVEPAR